MNRKQRLFVYVAAGIAAGLLIGGLVLYSMSRTQFGMERARRFAVSWLTERVDGTVHVGRISGRGLLRGVTLSDFYILDKRGRPFVRMDSVIVSYNWRTLLGGEIVIDDAVLFNPEIYFEQLPGDSVWNYQHVFPPRGGPKGARRLILLNDTRVRNGIAVVRVPIETAEDAAESERDVIEAVPGGRAKVFRFDSIFGQLPRVVWESPIEPGRLFDVRSLSGRGYVWREPVRVRDMRGTVTLRDTIVAFDMPDVRLAQSQATVVGRVIMEEGQNFFDVRVDSRRFTFPDLQWLYPRLPNSGGGSGVLRIQSQRPRGILWLATDTRLAAPGTRLAGSFGVVTGADSLYFTNVDLRASPLNLELIQDMLPKRLPLDGLLVGTVEVKGGLSSLDTKGNVQLTNSSGSSSVKWRGRFDVDGGFGAQNFRADLDKLDLAILTALRPSLKLRGQVTGHVEASGNVASSVRFAADIHHYLSGYTSSFEGAGIYNGGDAPGLDVELNARSLSLEELASTYPALRRLQGNAQGPIRLSGALDDMTVKADLETPGGRAQIDGRLMRGDVPRYNGEALLYSFRLDELIADLPKTTLDGKVEFDIAGNDGGDVAGRLRATLRGASVSGVDFRNARAAMRFEDGVAHIDTLVAASPAGQLRASGSLGMSRSRTGRLTFDLRADSTMGVVRGHGEINGSIQGFDLAGNLDIAMLNVGSVTSDRVAARITGIALGTDSGRVELYGRADSLVAFSERADSATLGVAYTKGGGTAKLFAGSRDGHEYVADAGLARRGRGWLFSLKELKLGQRSAPWKLAAPTSIETDDHGLFTNAVEVRRENGGRVRAAGRIAWHDASHTPELSQVSDFRLDFERVPFEEFALVTVGTANIDGTLEGHVRVTGNAIAPILEGDAFVDGFAIGDAKLDRLAASFTYADRHINARVDAEANGRRVLFADGIIPFDLAFAPVEQRKLAEPLRFSIQADSLPAAFLTSWVDGFSDVRGRMDGTLFASGTTRKPALGGSLVLKDGNAFWDVSGVRYRDVDATLRLEGERVARVDANVKANGGAGHVTGTIDFARLQNPAFDLTMDAQDFLAAKRRDAEFTASGKVKLGGHYRQPQITGQVAVEHGALYLDELYRRVQIVELDNPLLYDVVDTSIVSLRTILRTLNPFVKNLSVDNLRIDVGRESWLRSRDLNVEVAGNITIAFLLRDTLFGGLRTADDLRLTGTLRAGRGTYQLAGPGVARRFAIREGTIEFPGTPGVDPGLAFNAVYRARSSRREPIDIIAVVGGTLRNPRIRLTSDEEPPISESDLASYLFFGVPTYELTAGQSQALTQGTAGFNPQALGVGFATSTGFGYLANSLQTFAQNFGLLDYVSLTAAEVAPGARQQQSAIASLFAGTRLELGRYIGNEGEIYIAYSQPLVSSGYRPGVRLEWQLLPMLTGEFFAEDRFARTPAFGLESLSARKRVYGLFFFREWTY